MSLGVFVGVDDIVHDSREYARFLDAEGVDPTMVHQCGSIEELPVFAQSLFGDTPVYELVVDSIKVGALRDLHDRSWRNNETLVVVTGKTPRGNLFKDGIKPVVVDVPRGRQLENHIVDRFDISPQCASRVVASASKESSGDDHRAYLSALSLSAQLGLVDNDEKRSLADLYNPFRGETPPWNITNAVNDGDVVGAGDAVCVMLRKKSVKPQSLFIQLSGYYNKVICPDSPYFTQLHKRCHDVDGMIFCISKYGGSILGSASQGADYKVVCFVRELAQCFKSQ